MTDTLRALCELIDPVVVPHGFQTGQSPADETSGSVIWCTALADFSARFPDLPQSEDGGDPDADYGCIDLTIDLEEGRLVRLDLEGLPVTGADAVLGRRLGGVADALRRLVAAQLS